MPSSEILVLISAALNIVLGGGLLRWWFKYKVDDRKLNQENRIAMREGDRVDFGIILAEVKDQRDEAHRQVEAQNHRIDIMEAEIQGLRLARDLDPFPNWVVDLQGKYLFVNREFERHFLEPTDRSYRDIIGKTHPDLWPAAFCEKLSLLDIEARSRPDGKAKATTALTLPERGTFIVTVYKFPIRFKGVIVAYAGYMTDFDPEDPEGSIAPKRGRVYDQDRRSK